MLTSKVEHLVEKLDDESKYSLEKAAIIAKKYQNNIVRIEHWLLAFFDDEISWSSNVKNIKKIQILLINALKNYKFSKDDSISLSASSDASTSVFRIRH